MNKNELKPASVFAQFAKINSIPRLRSARRR